jgi:hypothetical protein
MAGGTPLGFAQGATADTVPNAPSTSPTVFPNGILVIPNPTSFQAINAAGGIITGQILSVNGTCTITAGSGAPTGNAPNGSLYLRYDGGTGTRLYVNTSGASTSGTTWTPIAGV